MTIGVSLRDAAREWFGAEWVAALEATTGCHAFPITRLPARDTDSWLLYGLLEALDWDCPAYNWPCSSRRDFTPALWGISSQDVKAFLFAHREQLLAVPLPDIPSFIGLTAGTFDFLWEDI